MPDKAVLRRQSSPNPRRLATFSDRMNAIGISIDTESCGTLMNSVFQIEDEDTRKGVETLLIKTIQRAKYFVSGRGDSAHYSFNVPLYTHFTCPSRRYADVLVHRQLDSIFGGPEFTEDVESLSKVMEMCNTKKESAHFAQEQSVHIEACRMMDRKAQEIGGELIAEGIVICVYESAFDVLIPEWGFEKRVHCDQLPLKKAEFDKHKRLLELYWEKGVPSSAYLPEDEQPKGNGRVSDSAQRRAREQAEVKRQQMDTNTRGTDEVDALFDDDDSDAAGVLLTTQSMPPSPTRGALSLPHRTKSDSKLSHAAGDTPETKLTNKEKYLSMFSLREEGGEYIQDVREMSRVPVILKTDLIKSPP
jgi:protein SSD1